MQDEAMLFVEQRSAMTRTAMAVAFGARNVIREDFMDLLREGLPRWASEGIWNDDIQTFSLSSGTTHQSSRYPDLEAAYSKVCHIETRAGDDAIRSRVALVRFHTEYLKAEESWKSALKQKSKETQLTAIGRGETSVIIDGILRSIHQGWDTFEHTRRSGLRAKFHDRKRYGKRWATFVEGLGPGVLIVCSCKVANMM
ncbi:hypothetical protein F4819DRAFT_272289 [Hypoxylon fuscum]|nr:hypothetical protein F4819DRAFT_272289 [Hypoxylon fuscum]